MDKEDFSFLNDLSDQQLWQILYHRKEFEDFCIECGVVDSWYDKS